jgi:tRNA(Ile)-lysidine synthase
VPKLGKNLSLSGMKEQFLGHLKQSQLCDETNHILLAVSGGMDSMVMLHLFHALKFRIGVAHCNFSLRGEESDGDEKLVKEVCERLGIPFFVKRFQTSEYAVQNDLSIQMAARELRYSWFDEVMLGDNFEYIATAHHLNDNVETVLMHFIRGTSLKGIPSKNRSRIRPLLPFTKQEIEKYACENNLQWREDSSNSTDDYTRNFIRHNITPLILKLNPGFEEGFQRTIKEIEALRALAESQIDHLKKKFLAESKDRIVIQKSFAGLFTEPAVVLWQIIRDYGFNFDQATEAISILDGTPGKRFLSPGFQMVIDRDTLIITPHQKFWDKVVINESKESTVLGAWEMIIERPLKIEIEPDKLTAWLDASLVKFPLTWRLWREGDHFFPLGMNHRKKISDFLIDNKLSLPDKDHITVLESDGEIVWVVGYRIDNRFKVTERTSQALKLTLDTYFV